MSFIELTDNGNDPVLFNLDHVSAIYRVHDHTRVIMTDCSGDEYYSVKESVQTIAERIKNLVPLIEREKESSSVQPNISITPYATETHTFDDSMLLF